MYSNSVALQDDGEAPNALQGGAGAWSDRQLVHYWLVSMFLWMLSIIYRSAVNKDLKYEYKPKVWNSLVFSLFLRI